MYSPAWHWSAHHITGYQIFKKNELGLPLACEQALCLRKIIARKGKGNGGFPLDQRPVHRLLYLGRWCISRLWWWFGERDLDLFDWDFRDLSKEKCPLRSAKNNVTDALFSIIIELAPSDTVAHCNSEDLVTVFEAITAWEITVFLWESNVVE